jgi:gliding motility associated protien GldN
LANAQVLDPSDDGIVPEQGKHFRNTRVVPYSFLRQDDMLWSTRHWERIDVREKINMPLYYPIQALPDRKSLFDVLVDGILVEGTISEIFVDDRFEIPLTGSEIEKRVSSYDTIRDPDDPSVVLYVDTIQVKSAHVVAWDVKSDWYFDKQRGELKNRIIGISPRVRNPKDKSEIYNLFWVWFPDARYAMATNVSYNVNNNNKRLTFDQIFHLRIYNSVVYKEDNVYDRGVSDYKRKSAMDQLLEAQYIREQLRNQEHDMWEF